MSRFHLTMDYASSDNDFDYKSDNGTMYNKKDDYWAHRNNDEYRSVNLLSKYSRMFGNGMLLELSEHVLSNKKNLPGKENARFSNASLETVKSLFQGKMTLNPFFKNVLEAQPIFHHIYSHERYKDPYGNVGWGVQDNIYNTDTLNFMMPFTAKVRNYATFNLTPTAKHESFKPEQKLQRTIPLSCSSSIQSMVAAPSWTSPIRCTLPV